MDKSPRHNLARMSIKLDKEAGSSQKLRQRTTVLSKREKKREATVSAAQQRRFVTLAHRQVA